MINIKSVFIFEIVVFALFGCGKNNVFNPGDDINWAKQYLAQYALISIAYGNGQFVAVGGFGDMVCSKDGINWTEQSVGHLGLNSILYYNGRFIAVGDSGTVITSSDGKNWQSGSAGASYNLYDITGDGKSGFIAVGNKMLYSGSDVGSINTSSDAVIWTAISPIPSYVSYYSIARGNNIFVIVGSDSNRSGIILTSADGKNWQKGALPTNVYPLKIRWLNNQFFLGAYHGIYTSSDGITWTRKGDMQYYYMCALAWSGNKYVAAGLGCYASNDGINWVSQSQPVDIIYDITYAMNTFVAVGYDFGHGATILTEVDPNRWTVFGLE